MKRFLREYKIELVAALLALLGIFLLVERMQIRVTILRIILLAWRTLSGTVGAVVRSVKVHFTFGANVIASRAKQSPPAHLEIASSQKALLAMTG